MTRVLRSSLGQITLNPVIAIAMIGAVLVALGVAWVFISNWHLFSTAVKIIILLGSTAVSLVCGYAVSQRGYEKTGEAIYFLTSLLWGLSVFIIAQQFHYGQSLHENSNLFFVSTIGPTTIAYLLRSKPSLHVALAMFFIWVWLQAAAFGLDFKKDQASAGFSHLLIFLGVPLFYSGLGLYHRAKGYRDFAKVYTYTAAGLILFQGFVLTLQFSQLMLAIPLRGLWSWYSLFFILIPLLTVGLGIRSVLVSGNLSRFDAYSGLTIWATYVLSAIIIPLILGTSVAPKALPEHYDFSIWRMSVPFIIQWLYFNVLFVALLLYVIDFSAREQRAELMKVALDTFGLYVLVRYAGFLIDLQGYLPMSIMFILGGIGLIALSIRFQKFRRFSQKKLA